MKIVIDIPDEMIPTKQEIIDIPIHFVDGKVCEVGGYGFTVLQEGYGDLIDGKALGDYFWEHRSKLFTYKDLQGVIDHAQTIIEADKESEE